MHVHLHTTNAQPTPYNIFGRSLKFKSLNKIFCEKMDIDVYEK